MKNFLYTTLYNRLSQDSRRSMGSEKEGFKTKEEEGADRGVVQEVRRGQVATYLVRVTECGHIC